MAIFQDSFTEPLLDTLLALHLPDVGTLWVEEQKTAAGNATVIASTDDLHFSASENSSLAAYSGRPSPIGAEYDVEVTFKQIYTGSGNVFAGIFARFTDDNDSGYAFQADMGGMTGRELLKRAGGSTTVLQSDGTGITAGDRIKLEIRNGAKRVYIDTGSGYVELFADPDNAITVAGEFGVYWGNLYTSGHIRDEIYFDDFVVTAALSASQPVYLAGALESSGSQPVYLEGVAGNTIASQPVYLAGQETAIDSQPVYLEGTGGTVVTASQPVYLYGQGILSAAQPIYLEGVFGTALAIRVDFQAIEVGVKFRATTIGVRFGAISINVKFRVN